MLQFFKNGQGSIVLRVKVLDSTVSTGAGKTGLTSASSGLIISTIADNEATATTYTQAGSTIETIATLGTFAAPTATKCRFKEVDATNHKGAYEIQIADARYAVSSAKSLLVSLSGVTGMAETDFVIPLTVLDLYTASTPQTGDAYNALAVATYAEPAQGTPAATTTLIAKINYLYKAWRNKSTQTATTYSLFNDDSATVDHKATTSDDGTTFSKGKVATGP